MLTNLPLEIINHIYTYLPPHPTAIMVRETFPLFDTTKHKYPYFYFRCIERQRVMKLRKRVMKQFKAINKKKYPPPKHLGLYRMQRHIFKVYVQEILNDIRKMENDITMTAT